MAKYEYLVKGFVHAGMMNPWPVNKTSEFEKLTQEMNSLGAEGWELIAVIPAGNMDREIGYFRRKLE